MIYNRYAYSVYYTKKDGSKVKKYASVITLPPTVSSSSASDNNDKDKNKDKETLNNRDKENFLTLKIKKDKTIESNNSNVSIERYSGIKSNIIQFKAKSVDKRPKRRDEIIRSSSIKICKIQSTQRIKHNDETSSFFNKSEIPPTKNRNLRANQSNINGKVINRSCAMNSGQEKEESKVNKLNKTPFNFKDRSGSIEKATKKILNSSNIIPKSLNMTSTIYTNLISTNIMSNRFTAKKIRLIEYKIKGNSIYPKNGMRQTSMNKIAFNRLDYYKDKNIINYTRTSSLKTFRNKKTVIQA